MIPPPGAITADAQLLDGVDLDAVATAVRACPSVVDLDKGANWRTIATYLPGREIPGIRVGDQTLTVQVRGRWGTPVVDLAAEVRFAVAGLVLVADLADPLADDAPEAGRTDPDPTSAPHSQTGGTPSPAVAPPVVVGHTVIVREALVVEERTEHDLDEPPTWISPIAGPSPGESSSAPTTPTGEETPPHSSPG